MSLASLNFLFRADTENFERKLRQSKKSVNNFHSGIAAVGKMVAGAFAVERVFAFGKACITAFDESEKAAALLLTAVDGNQESFKRLTDQAGLLQSNSLFDDESIKGAQMFLASMKLNEAQISRILPLVMDFATKFKVDLTSAANLVAKSIGGPTNALKRYGIESEGAAGSSERFESILKGLTRQVGGMSKAATEAGTSGLVTLKNALNDIMEVVGGGIGGPLNKFATNLKELIELRRGITETNFATQTEQEGRNFAAQGKTIDEAKSALIAYMQIKQKSTQELKATNVENIKESKKLGQVLAIGGHSYWDTIIKTTQANISGNEKAIEELKKLLNDDAAFQKWYADIHSGTGQQSYISGIDDKIKALKEEQSTLTETQRARSLQITEEIAQQERLKAAFLGTTKVERDKTDYELMTYEKRSKALDETIEKLEQVNKLQYQPGGEKYKLPEKGHRKLAKSTFVVDAGEGVSNEGLKAGIESLDKMITRADILEESMSRLGDTLSEGADSWREFGTAAVNALKRTVSGLIAEGIAQAVVKSIKSMGWTGLPAVGFGALAGGLAAGLFNTIIPKFANGGFADHPMLAQIGDASDGNGEWVLNSGQMKGLMGLQAAPVKIYGESRIRNNDIYISWTNASSFQQRTGGH